MASGINDLLDPFVCSCFPTSYQHMICKKLKWSTISISTALIIIIVYASSGLYTLIDVTTLMSTQSRNDGNDTQMTLWPIASPSMTILLSWISLVIYFTIALFIIILICGIQLSKPWLLFLWSIVMIIMLLVDGIITVLSLRQHQQQVHRSSKQVEILYVMMIIRLIISLCGIFITIFHFRQLNKARLEYMNRQRMLIRYNTESASTSHGDSWMSPSGLLNPAKDINENHYIPDLPSPMSLSSMTKVATIQRRPISAMFHSRDPLHSHSDYLDQSHEQSINEYHEDFRYNIPLEERHYQQKITHNQEL